MEDEVQRWVVRIKIFASDADAQRRARTAIYRQPGYGLSSRNPDHANCERRGCRSRGKRLYLHLVCVSHIPHELRRLVAYDGSLTRWDVAAARHVEG